MNRSRLVMAMVLALVMSTMAGAFAATSSTNDLTVTLAKAWFDVDGEITEGPETGWEVRLVQGVDDDIIRATLPGYGSYTWERDADDETVAYGVQETSADGWVAVPCSSVNSVSIDRDFEDVSTTGPTTTTFGGVHLVCNQAVEEINSRDQCKNGGWEAAGFKNQGQCLRFVNTGKDSR